MPSHEKQDNMCSIAREQTEWRSSVACEFKYPYSRRSLQNGNPYLGSVEIAFGI